MKKDNLWHYLWLIGVYLILMVILVMIVEYKVKWENKDFNTYLYFYNCSNNLCTSTSPISNYYTSIKCDNNECPYIKEKEDNLVILSLNNKEYVYDYINDLVINNDYESYTFADNSYIVKNKEDKYGIIDREGKVIVNFEYNKITNYRNGLFTYLEESKTGIKNIDNSININPVYEDAMIINDIYYSYLEDGVYYLAAYDTELPLTEDKYDYIYVTNNAVFTVKEKIIDILGTDLKSKLLLKIDTYYEYKTERERNSLNIYRTNNLLHFSVVVDEGKITNYIYDIKNEKLYV